MKPLVVFASCLLLGTLATQVASAQDREIVRISANVGLQEGPGRLSIDIPLTAPGGSGSFVIDDNLANSAFVDVNGSLRVWKGVALGAGFSKTNTEHLSHQYRSECPPDSAGSTESAHQ